MPPHFHSSHRWRKGEIIEHVFSAGWNRTLGGSENSHTLTAVLILMGTVDQRCSCLCIHTDRILWKNGCWPWSFSSGSLQIIVCCGSNVVEMCFQGKIASAAVAAEKHGCHHCKTGSCRKSKMVRLHYLSCPWNSSQMSSDYRLFLYLIQWANEWIQLFDACGKYSRCPW